MDSDNSSLCPVCERYIGPLGRCPYCDFEGRKKSAFHRLRWISVILSVLGLGFLWISAVCSEIPLIKVRDITPMTNFARVRVRGAVKENLKTYYSKDGEVDYARFSVDDGSGVLTVCAYRDTAREISQISFEKGDMLEVTGSISARGDGRVWLIIQSLDGIEIISSQSSRESEN